MSYSLVSPPQENSVVKRLNSQEMFWVNNLTCLNLPFPWINITFKKQKNKYYSGINVQLQQKITLKI